MSKFWKFERVKNALDDGAEVQEQVLFLNGAIADGESWFSDDVTPKSFREDLEQYSGDITVFINSPGGDVFAASQIYTMLKEHKGSITVKIDGIAASAASVIAMAGDMVKMSPTSMMMVHNPSMMMYGDAAEFEDGLKFLAEVKESIINAYQLKTGLSRAKLAKLMDAETWMNARAAHDMGFCDAVMYSENSAVVPEDSMIFDKAAALTNTVAAMRAKLTPAKKEPDLVDAAQFEKRLELLK